MAQVDTNLMINGVSVSRYEREKSEEEEEGARAALNLTPKWDGAKNISPLCARGESGRGEEARNNRD